MRDVQQAARRLVGANTTELRAILDHDPDMIRDVARALIRPIWKPCADHCARMDSEFGACSCGTVYEAEREAAQAKAGA